eukprot:TRINITY_DN24323_c0_g1_i1.p1 TRINITY_DN24323_c0_g1~~TRINITY_DN24323_c0_g1_i1.p1  ORF type:complete len:117 (+),score=17.29 TRINITY_DN24323_c0_g1_i1:71-421(+)
MVWPQIARLGGTFGAVVAKAFFDAYRMQAAQNVAAGTVRSAQRVTREMSHEEALQILNIRSAGDTAAPLSPSERASLDKHFERHFNANAPSEKDSAAGSPYLQGKVLSAYEYLKNK